MTDEMPVVDPPAEELDVESYYAGVRAACEAMRDDPVYYGPLKGKPGLYRTVSDVADFIEASL